MVMMMTSSAHRLSRTCRSLVPTTQSLSQAEPRQSDARETIEKHSNANRRTVIGHPGGEGKKRLLGFLGRIGLSEIDLACTLMLGSPLCLLGATGNLCIRESSQSCADEPPRIISDQVKPATPTDMRNDDSVPRYIGGTGGSLAFVANENHGEKLPTGVGCHNSTWHAPCLSGRARENYRHSTPPTHGCCGRNWFQHVLD